jgi:hypothetical protein
MAIVSTLAVFGIYALVFGDAFEGQLAVARWFLVAIGVPAAAFVLDMARQWRSLRPGAVITERGLLVESLGVSMFLPWNKIAGVRIGTVHGNRALFVDATEPSAVIRTGRGVLSLLRFDRQAGGDLVILLDQLVLPGEAVAELVTRVHERPTERDRLFDAPFAVPRP